MAREVWLALDMDEGVHGAFPTKRDAIEKMIDAKAEVHRFASGGYDVYDVWDVDDKGEFYLALEGRAVKDGFEWARDAWIEAGRPMGRFDEPIPGSADRVD